MNTDGPFCDSLPPPQHTCQTRLATKGRLAQIPFEEDGQSPWGCVIGEKLVLQPFVGESDWFAVLLKQMYIITPCSRPQNLQILWRYMNTDKLTQWIIVHDSKFSTEKKFSGEEKILELFCKHGTHGIAQRNMGISMVPPNGLIYFLDDDNIMLPQFWRQTFEPNKFTTFDSQHMTIVFTGKPEHCRRGAIDTCQFVVPRFMCAPWYSVVDNESQSDGTFVENVLRFHAADHVYIPKRLVAYNVLRGFSHYVEAYKAIYPDLSRMTNSEATAHFFEHGWREGRTVVKEE